MILNQQLLIFQEDKEDGRSNLPTAQSLGWHLLSVSDNVFVIITDSEICYNNNFRDFMTQDNLTGCCFCRMCQYSKTTFIQESTVVVQFISTENYLYTLVFINYLFSALTFQKLKIDNHSIYQAYLI